MENLLESAVTKNTDAAGSAVGLIIGVVVAIIVVVAVGIPITNDTITSANLSGTTKTIVQVVPVLMGVIPVVLISQIL